MIENQYESTRHVEEVEFFCFKFELETQIELDQQVSALF